MSRGMTSAAIAAAQAEVVSRTVAARLEFPGGTVRVNGSAGDIWIDGYFYLGVGGLGAISFVEESAELRAYDCTLTLSGVPGDAIALALGEAYQGSPGTIWEVLFNRSTGAVIADPIIIFRGRMDQMSIELGQTAAVTITLQDFMADWERPRIRRYTMEDQTGRHPGDTGLRFLAATVEKQIIWPAGAWWDRR